MKWRTGNFSSSPSDGRAFLERAGVGGPWVVYKTDEEGILLPDFPKLTEERFEVLEDAQQWVEDHVPARLET